MGWSQDYNEYEIVNDYTNTLSKIWDNLMPLSFPYVLEFKTMKAVEVFQRKEMGPYHMNENFIDYICKVKVDNKPLYENGWNGKDRLKKDLVDKSYGENYFYDMRQKLVSLSVYAGLNFSHFDFGGKLTANAKEL